MHKEKEQQDKISKTPKPQVKVHDVKPQKDARGGVGRGYVAGRQQQ